MVIVDVWKCQRGANETSDVKEERSEENDRMDMTGRGSRNWEQTCICRDAQGKTDRDTKTMELVEKLNSGWLTRQIYRQAKLCIDRYVDR